MYTSNGPAWIPHRKDRQRDQPPLSITNGLEPTPCLCAWAQLGKCLRITLRDSKTSFLAWIMSDRKNDRGPDAENGHDHFSYHFFLIAPRERALERPCSSPTSFAARSHDGVGMMRNQGIGREHFQHAIDNTTFPDSNLSIRKGGGADLHLIEALYGKLGEDTSNVSSTIRVRSVYFCTMNPAPSEWP